MDTWVEIRPGRRMKLAVYPANVQAPTIFMIHGMGGRGYQWREQVNYLKDRYTLIVPDLLGQGDSEKPSPGKTNLYRFEELRKDLQLLFDRYAGEQNFVFGHSYGGALATFLAKDKLAKVRKLVLITPVSCQPFDHIPLVYAFPVPVLELLRSYLDASFEKLAFASTDNPGLLRVEREGRNLNHMEVIKALLLGMKTIPSLSLGRLAVPSLVICGKLDRVIPPETVKAFYSQLPQHQLYILENAAHMVHLEKSQEVNRLLEKFLSR